MVLLAGSELFTGNCLILIPVLEGRVPPAALGQKPHPPQEVPQGHRQKVYKEEVPPGEGGGGLL